MTRTSACWAIAVLLRIAVLAQEPKPTFEVASVKQQTSFVPPTGPPTGEPASRTAFRRSNATLVDLVRFAYGLLESQVSGGPEWIRKDWFEINAKAATEISTEQMRPMLQSLLEERFALVAHKEQREMRSYTLVLARSDGRLGTNLERCDDPSSRTPSKPVRLPPGGTPFSERCVSMSAFARRAAAVMNAPVVDKTGLTGLWTYSFVFGQIELLPAGRERELAEKEDLLPFPAAIQENLGLRLESARGPVEVLVIDSVQRPTEN